MVLLPLSLSAQAMAQASSPEPPRMLEWGGFADDGPAAVAKPVVRDPVRAVPVSTPAAVPAAPPVPATASAPETTAGPAGAADPSRGPHSKGRTGPATGREAVDRRRSAQAAVAQDARPRRGAPGATVPVPAMDSAAPGGGTAPTGDSAHDFLERTAAKALALSPDVREATAKWEASRFDIDEVKGQRWPQLQVGVASPSATFGGGTNDSARDAIGNVQLTTPVYDWGRISRTVESRTETANAAREQMLQVRQQVAYDTVNALIELRRNQQAMLLSDAYVGRMTELVEMLAEIVKSDRGRDSELVQARGRRLQALADPRPGGGENARGRDQPGQAGRRRGQAAVAAAPGARRWSTSRRRSRPRPNIRRCARPGPRPGGDLYAKSVHASRYPQLNWVVSKTTQQDTYGNSQPWATGLSVQWNAFQGGSAAAAERAAFGRAQAGEEKAMAATRDLEYRLRTSAQQRDAALSRAEEYTPLIKDSDRVRKIFFEQWYHLGKRTLLDVLIAENDHYNNQIAQVNSRYDGEAADLRIRRRCGDLAAVAAGRGRRLKLRHPRSAVSPRPAAIRTPPAARAGPPSPTAPPARGCPTPPPGRQPADATTPAREHHARLAHAVGRVHGPPFDQRRQRALEQPLAVVAHRDLPRAGRPPACRARRRWLAAVDAGAASRCTAASGPARSATKCSSRGPSARQRVAQRARRRGRTSAAPPRRALVAAGRSR